MNRVFSLITIAGVLFSANLASSASYKLIDVGVFPDGDYSRIVKGLNDAGQVVGFGNVNNTLYDDRAFLFSGGDLQNLGQLPSINSFMVASAINNQGQVVGYGDTGPNASTHAWLWSSGSGLTDLGTLPGEGASSAAGINSAGFVVGDSNGRVFIWDVANGMREVVSVGTGAPNDINDTGIVVGQRNDMAFRWLPEESLANADATNGGTAHDLGTLLGASTSIARGVNALGDVVGQSGASSSTKAFLWTEDEGMVDLGFLPEGDRASAFDLDDAGNVVGWSRVAGERRAFIWNDADGMLDLNSLLAPGEGVGWGLNEAYAINSSGQIAGIGTFDGETRAFLLAPIAPTLGDTDNDGDVDLDDLNNVRNNFGAAGFGDTDGDSDVDLDDLNNVRNNFGAESAPNSVPEPSAILLAALGGIVLAARRAIRRA